MASSYSSFVAYKNEIESLFNKIMSPVRKEIDPNLVAQLCAKLNSDLDGGQIVLDLITHKIQSSQEWEAIIAFYVLEACVKNCGDRFHDLIGRFRFLNEMIKLISPKYLGNQTTDKVKKRCIELLYSWSEGLPDKAKIKEAYDMLKRQGLVQSDPANVEKLKINITPRPKNQIFDDESKSKELARLLKSRNPQDLELANRLIKNMVKQDEMQFEKQCSRQSELEHIKNNIKLLNEMLLNYNSKQTSDSEKETIKYLYEELEKHKPSLIKLATESDDNDESIGEIIQVNEQCERIINQYSKFVLLKETHSFTGNKSTNEDVQLVNLNANAADILESNTATSKSTMDPLKELEDLFSPSHSDKNKTNANVNILSDFNDFISLPASLSSSNPASNIESLLSSIKISSNSNQKSVLTPSTSLVNSFQSSQTSLTRNEAQKPSKPFDDLNQLGLNLFENKGSNGSLNLKSEPNSLSLSELQQKKQTIVTNDLQNIANTEPSSFAALKSLNVELESIKPSSLQPFTLHDKNNLKVLLYFGRDQPISDVNVLVITVTSSNTQAMLKNFTFQAAVPKSMKVKLQPASRLDLPVYNPILPPSAITQIMLVANPNREQIRLKYKISYAFDDLNLSEPEEVKTLPVLNDLL